MHCMHTLHTHPGHVCSKRWASPGGATIVPNSSCVKCVQLMCTSAPCAKRTQVEDQQPPLSPLPHLLARNRQRALRSLRLG